ncbi:hypothetical protein COO60DRAFT_348826 [Scenedesmus sp. NREL 46B-D3]|nr:hypothetical protein COO60DRAFT_348826 [Scenedesmus sp. NREL 46B-D3]
MLSTMNCCLPCVGLVLMTAQMPCTDKLQTLTFVLRCSLMSKEDELAQTRSLILPLAQSSTSTNSRPALWNSTAAARSSRRCFVSDLEGNTSICCMLCPMLESVTSVSF